MTTTQLTQILLVEDNPADARLIEEYVIEQSWPNIEPDRPSIEHVERLEAARDTLTDDIDFVLLDLGLPDSTGVETLETIQREMDFSDRGSRPSTAGVGHTGYLVFGRAP